jgi:hypothetical protein
MSVGAASVGDMDMLEAIRAFYVEVNGDHPMTAPDDEYVRRLFVPLAADGPYSLAGICRMIHERQLPVPSYVLSDGTLMVHPGYVDNLRAAGGPRHVEGWFRGHWPADQQDVAAEEWDSYLSGQYVCLYEVTPETIQAKTRLIEEIKDAVARLDAAPGDDPTREQLRASVDELDELEPPFAPSYDRLRFGGPSSREVWIDDVRARHLGRQTV